MIIDPVPAQATVAGWVALVLIAIAGVSNVLTKLAALKEQVKTLFKTADAHETRLTSQDAQLTTVAAALPTTTATVSTSGPVVVDQTQGDRP